MLAAEEVTTYHEAATETMWQEAMQKKFEANKKNKTWALTNLRPKHKPIGLKWAFKLKKNSKENVIKLKARLGVNGYVWRQGDVFEDVFVHVARLDTIKLILDLAAQYGWEVHHSDVKLAFLNGALQD